MCTNFFMNYCLVAMYSNCVVLMRPGALASRNWFSEGWPIVEHRIVAEDRGHRHSQETRAIGAPSRRTTDETRPRPRLDRRFTASWPPGARICQEAFEP